MEYIGKIELCEMPNEKLAARAKIKMTALKISRHDTDNNDNGINWFKQYIQDNIKSFIGAAYKVAFLDADKTYPSGHGDMERDEDGNVIFPNSDTVGSIQDAYIDTIEIDGEMVDVVTTEGYLYIQSYPNFYRWLKEEVNSNTVFGSIEINGKGDNKNIIYEGKNKAEDGSPYVGRKPMIFDFTALAILSDFVPPADQYSRVIELNQKESINSETNSINDGSNTVKDILTNNNKEENKMDEKVILELNEKIESKTTEINELKTQNNALSEKNVELNETIVSANKSLEESKAQVDSLTAELNSCKEELEALKAEKESKELEEKKVEVNSYYKNELVKNGFSEEEINSFSHFVDEVDLAGLKTAEAELCTKKFKEMREKKEKASEDFSDTETEVNNANTKVTFITINEKEKKVIADKDTKITFFN